MSKVSTNKRDTFKSNIFSKNRPPGMSSLMDELGSQHNDGGDFNRYTQDSRMMMRESDMGGGAGFHNYNNDNHDEARRSSIA